MNESQLCISSYESTELENVSLWFTVGLFCLAPVTSSVRSRGDDDGAHAAAFTKQDGSKADSTLTLNMVHLYSRRLLEAPHFC